MPDTWVLVCDKAGARVFSYAKAQEPWEFVAEIDNPAGRSRTGDLVSDQQGRVKQSFKAARPAMEPSTDPTDVEAHRFAEQLSQVLERGFNDHRYESLALVAPPRFLGHLRKALGDPVARAVVLTLDKDLARLELRDLHARLSPQLA